MSNGSGNNSYMYFQRVGTTCKLGRGGGRGEGGHFYEMSRGWYGHKSWGGGWSYQMWSGCGHMSWGKSFNAEIEIIFVIVVHIEYCDVLELI